MLRDEINANNITAAKAARAVTEEIISRRERLNILPKLRFDTIYSPATDKAVMLMINDKI